MAGVLVVMLPSGPGLELALTLRGAPGWHKAPPGHRGAASPPAQPSGAVLRELGCSPMVYQGYQGRSKATFALVCGSALRTAPSEERLWPPEP